jgi:hypothetical protein
MGMMRPVDERYLAAPLDRAAWMRSLATVAALFAVLVIIFFAHQLAPVIMLLALPVIAAPAYAFAASPLGYVLNERTLTIERKTLWSIRIPLAQISACHPLPRAALQDAIRVYGSGGLFSWSGRYRARTLGAFSMYATNLDQLILVQRRRRRPIVISPADGAAFLTGLRRQYETLVVPPSAARRPLR